MIPKKIERKLITALMIGALIPSGASAAEESDVEVFDFEAPTEVEAEVNEDSLRYLLLVDTFETAERIPTKRLQTPAEVVVITSDEIDANHYQSVDEALSHVNGMVAATVINGNARVLTLVDGRRTFIYPPMKMIERIEIVKGGGSALYGSDAVGGVVNIITKRGDHNETTVDINTGSWHRHTYEVTNQGNDGRLGWFIDAGIGKSRPYNYRGNNDPTRSDQSSDYDSKYAAVRLDHRFDDRNSLTFDINHRSSASGRYDIDPLLYPQSGVYNQVALTYNFKEGTSTPGFLRYFNNYSSTVDEYNKRGSARLQGADYQNGWELGQHRLIVGFEWHQSADVSDYIDFANTKRKVNNQAYYIQDTITMGDKWTVVPGTRLDHNGQFGSQWSPKVAANYSPDDQTKFFASWGRVYQAPSPLSLYSRFWFTRAFNGVPYLMEVYQGDANLKPETGHTETIGVEHDFSDKVNVTMSLFNANVGNYLDRFDRVDSYDNAVYPYTFDTATYYFVNSVKDKQRGANLVYRQKIDDHWSYNLGYAYTHREHDLGDEQAQSHYRVPRNSYSASIRYQNGPWKATLHGMAGSGSGGQHYFEDNFAMWNFNISCDVSDWTTIYAKAINFTNQNYSYFGRNFNIPGRLFQFGLDCRF